MLTSAPTDNLYKFLTFLGVALLIFCSWSYTDASKRLDVATIEKVTRDVKRGERQATINYRLGQMRDLNADQSLSDEDKIKRSKELAGEILALTDEAKTTAFAEMLPELTQLQIADDMILYEIGLALGLAMTLLGSAFWYGFHQRHQDALLIEQVLQAKAATKKAGSATGQPDRLPMWRRVGFSHRKS